MCCRPIGGLGAQRGGRVVGHQDGDPGELNCPALPFAAGVPVQPAVLKIFTFVPDAAFPCTLGLLLLAGEAGVVPVIFGVAGGCVSTVNDRDRIVLTFPGASIARTKKVWTPSDR